MLIRILIRMLGLDLDLGRQYNATVLCAPDARFLYISNRDVCLDVRLGVSVSVCDNGTSSQPPSLSRCSIAVFAVLHEGTQLQPLQQVSSLGCHPRAMTLLHGGSHLAVANKDGGYCTQSSLTATAMGGSCDSDNDSSSLKRSQGGNLVVFPIAPDATGLLLVEEALVTDVLFPASLQSSDIMSEERQGPVLAEPTWLHPFTFNSR